MQDRLRQKIRQSVAFWLAAVPILLADQVSKAWVLSRIPMQPREGGLDLSPDYAVIPVPHLLAFIHTRNEGAAFSVFQAYPILLAGVAAVLSVGVLVWALWYLPAPERLSRVALGLIFGGAAGNLVDRVLHDWQVVDFILVLVRWRGRMWPTFNLADSAICVGIGLFMIAAFRAGRGQTAAEEAPVKKRN
jgi:signal peptidase II